jgi:hypothetical protein
MESSNNSNGNINNSNSLEQRFRMEIMRKDAHTPTRKGRRPLVAASKSFVVVGLRRQRQRFFWPA